MREDRCGVKTPPRESLLPLRLFEPCATDSVFIWKTTFTVGKCSWFRGLLVAFSLCTMTCERDKDKEKILPSHRLE